MLRAPVMDSDETIDRREFEETLASDMRASLRPAATSSTGALETAIAKLRESEGVALERGELLGVGGMGVVHAATQTSLDRRVAVKSLRDAGAAQSRTLQLLQEAWITGTLEHPNIVPVHDLRLGPDGPELVLREIVGTPWSVLVHDERRVQERFATDRLDWNLRTLMQVCHAVEFAHSLDILHRDLKPENVMIGDYGEVYLLDWGIAVRLGDDTSGRFPLAKEALVAGTPVYMAPEMLETGSARLSPRTDVYLLGSILYELLSGEAPHMRDTPQKIMFAVALGDPEAVNEDPSLEEIWEVCLRAMSRDPDDRFPNVETLRLAIQDFLEHRGALELTEQAILRLQLLERAVEGRIDAAHREELYRLFAECRFGFRQALLGWEGNKRAAAGLRRALTCMIEHELAQGEPRSAQTLLAELTDPPKALRERVAVASADEAAERTRLTELAVLGQRHERDHDRGIGVRARFAIAVMLGSLMSVTPFVYAWWLMAYFPPSHLGLVVFTGVILAVVAGAAFFARSVLLATAVNRNFFAALFAALGGQIVLNLGCWVLGVPTPTIRILDLAVWFVAAAYGSFVTQSAFLPTAIGYLIGFGFASLHPEWRYEITGAANFVLTVNLIVVWWPLITGQRGASEDATRADGDA